jgi:hypothetical protein
MKKKWGNILAWVIGFLCAGAVVWATTIKDDMRYEGNHTHIGNMTRTGNLTQTGTMTHTGAISLNGGVVAFNDAPAMIDTAISATQVTASGVHSGTSVFYLPDELDTGVIYTVNAASVIVGASGTTTAAGPDQQLGVSVIFPVVSLANDNKVFAVQKVESGTSALVCCVDGTQTIGASGATYYANMDAIGDVMWFRCAYGSSGVSYYYLGGHIQ